MILFFATFIFLRVLVPRFVFTIFTADLRFETQPITVHTASVNLIDPTRTLGLAHRPQSRHRSAVQPPSRTTQQHGMVHGHRGGALCSTARAGCCTQGRALALDGSHSTRAYPRALTGSQPHLVSVRRLWPLRPPSHQ